VIRGVLPDGRGLNATDVFENTAIVIDLEQYAASMQEPAS
jgi:hypothetical protein